MFLAPLFIAVFLGTTTDATTAANLPRQELHSLQQDAEISLSLYNTIPGLAGPEREMEQTPNFLLNEKSLLSSHGVDFFMSYTSDIAGNPVGGINPNGFTYTDFFYFGCILDSQKLLGWPGGSFTISTAQVDGNSLSEKNIGNEFPIIRLLPGELI